MRPTAFILMGLITATACGGSSSETPPPVEPVSPVIEGADDKPLPVKARDTEADPSANPEPEGQE